MAELSRADIPGILAKHGIDSGNVSLYGAHDNDTVAIDNRPDGWVVFYSERGSEFSSTRHQTEDAACRDLLLRLGVTIE